MKRETSQQVSQNFRKFYERVMGDGLSVLEAHDLLIAYGQKLCFRVLADLEPQEFRPDEPLPWYRSRLKKEESRQEKRGQAMTKGHDTALDTHLALDNQLLGMGFLTQAEYGARRQAWKSGERFERPDAQCYCSQEVRDNRKAHAEAREVYLRVWGAALRLASDKLQREDVRDLMLWTSGFGSMLTHIAMGGPHAAT